MLCDMSLEELILYSHTYELNVPADVLPEYCFRSVFVFEILHDGFGFSLDSNITATNVINGHKVSWALGSILYEINTLPWIYLQQPNAPPKEHNWTEILISGFVAYVLAIVICFVYRNKKSNTKKEVDKRLSSDIDDSSETATARASNVNQGAYGSLGRHSDRHQGGLVMNISM